MTSLADFVVARLVDDEPDEALVPELFELLAGEHVGHGDECRRLRLLAEAFGVDHPEFEERWKTSP